jgi:hypothetical protein
VPEFTEAVVPWPPHLYAYIPAPVRTASEALQAAVDRLVEAQRAATASGAAVEAAQAADRASARLAVESGRQPPTSTVPTALERAERAKRAVEACTAIAREAQNAFVATQLEHVDDTVAALHDRQGAVRQVLDARLDEIAAGLREMHALDYVLAELTGGTLRHRRAPSFQPVRARPRRPRDLGEEAVQPLRATIAGHAPDNTFVAGPTA